MLRLFWAEFRRSLVDNLLFAGSLAALVIVFRDWILVGRVGRNILDELIALVLFAIISLSAPVQGAATFSPKWSDKYWLQAFSVPMDRSFCWVALVWARLIGYLVGIAFLLTLNPSLWRHWNNSGVMSPGLVLAIPVLFSLGLALTMLIRGRVLLYTLVYFFGAVLYALILIATVHLYREPLSHPTSEIRVWDLGAMPVIREPLLLLLHVVFVCCVLFEVSRRIFIRGEYDNPQRRRVGLLVAALVLLVLGVAIPWGAVRGFYSALSINLDEQVVVGTRVTHDDGFVYQVNSLESQPHRTTVEVFSARSGHHSGTLSKGSIIPWSVVSSGSNDSVLVLVEAKSVATMLGLAAPEADLWEIFPDGNANRLAQGFSGLRHFRGLGYFATLKADKAIVFSSPSEVTEEFISERAFRFPKLWSQPNDTDPFFRVRDCGPGVYSLNPDLTGTLLLPVDSEGHSAITLPKGHWVVRSSSGGLVTEPGIPYVVREFGVPALEYQEVRGLFLIPAPCPVFDIDSSPLLFYWREPIGDVWGLHLYERSCKCWVALVNPRDGFRPPIDPNSFDTSIVIRGQVWASGLENFERLSVNHSALGSAISVGKKYVAHSTSGEDIRLFDGTQWKSIGKKESCYFLLLPFYQANFGPGIRGPVALLSCRKSASGDVNLRENVFLEMGESGMREVARVDQDFTRYNAWNLLYLSANGRQIFRTHSGERIHILDREGQLIKVHRLNAP